MKVLLDLLYRMKAKYPILYVLSHEEDRFMAGLRKIMGADKDSGAGQHAGRRLFVWSMTEGLVEESIVPSAEAGVERKPVEQTEDLAAALAHMKKEAEKNIERREKRLQEENDPEKYADRIARGAKGEIDDPAEERRVYVLKDVHPFLDIAIARRFLRDLAATLPHTDGTTIILFGPVLVLPPDLEKCVTVIDFPLPTYEEMVNLVTLLQRSNKKRIKAPIDAGGLAQAAKACLGLTRDEAENVVSRSISEHGAIVVREIISEKQQIIRKAGLEFKEPKIALNELGGMEDLKEYLLRVDKAKRDPKAGDACVPIPKGIVLLGPPGSGKSGLVEAIAKLFGVPLVIFDFGALKGSLVGETEGKVRNALSRINSMGPCVVRMDEYEKMFAGVMGPSTDSGTTQSSAASIFSWMQDRESEAYIVATMNRLFDAAGQPLVAPESLRKGRWDELFFIDLPTPEQRAEIFRIHLRKRRRDPQRFDVAKLADTTEGYSGAEVEKLIEEAIFYAFYEDRDIRVQDILDTIGRTSPLSQTMKEEIHRIREWVVTQKRARPASAARQKRVVRPTMAREV